MSEGVDNVSGTSSEDIRDDAGRGQPTGTGAPDVSRSDQLPDSFGLRLHPSTITELCGRTLLGGDPFRVVRLTATQAEWVRSWQEGDTVGAIRSAGSGTSPGRLARALVTGNLAISTPPLLPPNAFPDWATTIVIPVRDRPRELDRLLVSVSDTASVGAVLVVDDASEDATPVRRVAAEHGALFIGRAIRGGSGAARNTGLANVTTPLVAFLDSDVMVRPGWLTALTSHLADPLVAMSAPRVTALATPDPSAIAIYEAHRSGMDRGQLPGTVRAGGRVPFVPGAALLGRVSALRSVGGFDETLTGGEDVDLVWRLVGSGWSVRYEPGATVAHDNRTALRAWLSRRAYYGRTAAPIARRHPAHARPLAVSTWSSAAWALVALGHPLAAVGLTAVATGLLSRRLHGLVDQPVTRAAQLAGGGTWHSGRAVADAAMRTWWPISLLTGVVFPRLRWPLAAAAVIPALLDWRTDRPAMSLPTWIGLRVLDDAAYGWGVWQGVIGEWLADPVLPARAWTLEVNTADQLVDSLRVVAPTDR